jgi:hypothetical protein
MLLESSICGDAYRDNPAMAQRYRELNAIRSTAVWHDDNRRWSSVEAGQNLSHGLRANTFTTYREAAHHALELSRILGEPFIGRM